MQIILTVEENVNIRKNVINSVADNGRKENDEVCKFRKIGFESVPHLYGGMGFGDAAAEQHSWTVDESRTREIIKHGLELGINFYDTAIAYQNVT